MSYVVFARKWRPRNFDEIVGQEHITTTLKNAISNNRVAHAYMFAGPRGIGKTSAARILAKGLNCEKGSTPSPCGKCSSCNSISSGVSMDVIEIDGASNNSVDQIRELRENIKFSPAYGRYKVYIIDEVHMLSTGAFNALLKILEEPPKHAKFIFATTNPEKVLPTVLSRCQRFDFRRIPLKLIIAKLVEITKAEKLNVSEDALFSIASAGGGSMRDAESVLDQLTSFCEKKIGQKDVIELLGIIEEDKLAAVVDGLSEKNAAALLKIIDEIINAGRDISQFLMGMMGYIRNLMILKVGPGLRPFIDLPDNYTDRLSKQTGKFQLEDLLYIFYTLSTTANTVRQSDTARFILEAAFIKLTLRSELMSLSEIMDKVSRLESYSRETG
ncbi:MAG: DNA polymerase III subunit gamma/tau, partial [Candidatus Omnitrophota bacterium]|nr:DNA polymerase III subunit gamma/tau [Candidatus Omnitrophota bacterium]